MDVIKSSSSRWFTETSPLAPSQGLSMEVEEVLVDEQSKFQHVLVFRSKAFGTVLALDGAVQVTDADEFAYQEMIAHLPLCAHPNPRRVLVIGGGDGGVLREVVKHDCVEKVTLCEIDEKVIEVSKKYLPQLAVGFTHPKVDLVVGDGFKYLQDHQGEFDVIITDSSDPVGPAESLFQREFFELMKRSLNPEGIICTQGESIYLHLNTIKDVLNFSRGLFAVVKYAITTMPTYPSGQIGFVMCSPHSGHALNVPVRTLARDVQDQLKYYSPEIHAASFVLPQFARKALDL